VNPFFLALLLGFATYRVSHAVAVDEITQPARQWLYQKQWLFLFRLASCPSCVGFWIALIFTLTWGFATQWLGTAETLILWFATAGVGTLASSIDLRLKAPQ
jgi:hypothetical protein